MMEWEDVTHVHATAYDFVFHWRIQNEHHLVVWKCKRDMGYGTSTCIQVWDRNNSQWRALVKTPEGTTVDEAKTLALVLYRMGG